MGDEFLTEIKKVVADPTAGPKLNDLLNAEAGRLITALTGDEFDPAAPPSNEAVVARLDRYVVLTADLARAVALGARWSGDSVRPIWPSLIERVVAAVDRAPGQTIWADLSLYPGLLLLYASGVGAWPAADTTTFAPSFSSHACATTTNGCSRSRSSTRSASSIRSRPPGSLASRRRSP